MFAYVVVELSPHYNSFVRQKKLSHCDWKEICKLIVIKVDI